MPYTRKRNAPAVRPISLALSLLLIINSFVLPGGSALAQTDADPPTDQSSQSPSIDAEQIRVEGKLFAADGTTTQATETAYVRRLQLPTKDITYDPRTQTMYASVPGSAGVGGNSITPINPATGVLGTPVFVGSEPGKLALSDDGQYLYVALEGAGAVRRLDVATQTPGQQFALGTGQFGGQFFVEDMEVLPGNPEAVAVSRRNTSSSPRHEGVAVYDNGVRRSVTTPVIRAATSLNLRPQPRRSTVTTTRRPTSDFARWR